MSSNRVGAALFVVLSSSFVAACGGTEPGSTAVASGAVEVAVCRDAIAVLQVQTDAVVYTSNQARQDEAGLLAKLGGAVAKLDAGDFGSAAKRLYDYLHQLENLIKNGEIAPSPDGSVTPDMLVAGASAAIACVQTP
jgi:hypothetical protein